MRWLLLHYQPTTLFALKSSLATSTVGRTLIIPTPYAIKMAFVDAAFRAGKDDRLCRQLVEDLVGVEVRVRPGTDAVVTQTIQLVRQEAKQKTTAEIYVRNVAYREIVYISGSWSWALDVAGKGGLAEELLRLAPVIHYVGKRGSMVQYLGTEWTDELGPEFTVSMAEVFGSKMPPRSHIAVLDDFGSEASFPWLNSFDPDSKPKLHKHRAFVHTLVPAGIANSGPSFVHYSSGHGS